MYHLFHMLDEETMSIAVADTDDDLNDLHVRDLLTGAAGPIDPAAVISVAALDEASGEVQAVYPYPTWQEAIESRYRVANPAEEEEGAEDGVLIPFDPKTGRMKPKPIRRKAIDLAFETGYTIYARNHALKWRSSTVHVQPVSVACAFAILSIRTPIHTTNRVTSDLRSWFLAGTLPDRDTMITMLKPVGFQDNRERGIRESFETFAPEVARQMNEGMRDDRLRRHLAMTCGTPNFMAMAKVSFVLSLMGNNTGCLDARILTWAYGAKQAEAISGLLAKKTSTRGTCGLLTVGDTAYTRYKDIEDKVLRGSTFYDPRDPVGLAKAQWLLWEATPSYGVVATHPHAEMFESVTPEERAATGTAEQVSLFAHEKRRRPAKEAPPEPAEEATIIPFPGARKGNPPARFEASTTVQSLVFDRAHFTPAQATKWAANHGFSVKKPPHVRENTVSIRQADPTHFEEGTFRTIPFRDGVHARVAVPRAQYRKSNPGITLAEIALNAVATGLGVAAGTQLFHAVRGTKAPVPPAAPAPSPTTTPPMQSTFPFGA